MAEQDAPVRRVEDMTDAERVTTARALISEILTTYRVELMTSLGSLPALEKSETPEQALEEPQPDPES